MTSVSNQGGGWNATRPLVDPSVNYVVGGLLAVIGSLGFLGNALVLVVFTKLRGPFSAFILNLAVADLCTSLLHTMAVASSFSQTWVFGDFGCQLYACGVGHFGLLSIVTLATIAVERYMVITSKPLSKSWLITQYSPNKVCMFAWIYCLSMSVPPLLGWSRYMKEGFDTSCSWDYYDRSDANRAYYVYLLILGFLLPVAVILYCYTFIMAAILAHGRGSSSAKENGGVTLQANMASRDHIPEVGHPLSSTFRTAEIIFVLVLLFLVSWTPYAVVTFIAQFGDRSLVTPWVSALPAIFAKASVVYNPIVFGLSHPHFRSAVRQIFRQCVAGGSGFSLEASQGFSLVRKPERGAASSPGTMRRHSQDCPRKGGRIDPERHSEPGPRAKSGAVRHADMDATWLPGSGKVKSGLVGKLTKGHLRPSHYSTAITSEGFDTIGPTSATPPLDLSATTKTRSFLNIGRR